MQIWVGYMYEPIKQKKRNGKKRKITGWLVYGWDDTQILVGSMVKSISATLVVLVPNSIRKHWSGLYLSLYVCNIRVFNRVYKHAMLAFTPVKSWVSSRVYTHAIDGFAHQTMRIKWTGLDLSLYSRIGRICNRVCSQVLVGFVASLWGKHWLCLYLCLYASIGRVCTWFYTLAMVGFILEAIRKLWSCLCVSLCASIGWVLT